MFPSSRRSGGPSGGRDALDRALRDVGPHLLAIELDLFGRIVGTARGRPPGWGRARSRSGPVPPAVTISPSRTAVPAWVTSAIARAAASRPVITSPLDERLGIAGRGQHHGHRPVLGEVRLACRPGRPARGTAEQSSSRSRAQPRQHRLGLGIAEAAVELEHLGAGLGHHQPGVEDAVEGGAAAGHQLDNGAVDAGRRSPRPARRRSREPASSCPCRRCSGPRRRRGSACSPGPAPGAPRSPRRRAPAGRAPRPPGTPRGRPRSARSAARQRKPRPPRGPPASVCADDHSLAGGEPVRLEHAGIRGAGDLLERLLAAPEHGVRGRRHAGLGHQLLGDGPSSPRAWRPPRRGRRPRFPPPRARRPAPRPAAPPVPRSQGPRLRRGPRRRSRRTSSAPISRQRASAAMPGVARGAENVGRSGRAPQRAHDRVLASAAADHQDLHLSAARAPWQGPPTGSPPGSGCSSCRASRARPRPWPSSSRRAPRRW